MSDAIAGSCRACSRDLVQVIGERTYHPHDVDLVNEPCPALLPIGCPCECFSSDVPDSEFIPTTATAERGELAPTADRDDLAAILNAHKPDKVYRSYPCSFRCTCGETVENLNDHLADVVLQSDWLRGVKADMWDVGFNDGAHYASADLSHATYRTPPPPNPYRADRVDADTQDNTTDRT